MKLKQPNVEQQKAISHQGGVLLKAGAGSGKTFVLVEHIIYLTNLWIEEFKTNNRDNFDEYIKGKFSKLVLMTFTKKAAGEMSIRIYERFQLELEIEGDGSNFWKIAYESINSLNITTIDGFCKKLISKGYFPGIPVESSIIFYKERKQQISDLFNQWLSRNQIKISPDIFDLILKNKNDFLGSITSILMDPGLRLAWKNTDFFTKNDSVIALVLKESFKLNSINQSLEKVKALIVPIDSECSAFERNINIFQKSGLPEISSFEELCIYKNLFDQFKTLQPERTASKKDYLHQQAHEGLVELRDWVKIWYPVVSDYIKYFDDKIFPLVTSIRETFFFIESSLSLSKGLTFGDVEYVVHQGLQTPEIASRVRKDFDYFIVDEFQDTSELQFEIITRLINHDFSKLFCVGDAKQAIYGFRGGELAVFNRCSSLVPLNLSLVNNYRSKKCVINFNNVFFDFIFPLGREFSGKDFYSVSVDYQDFPLEDISENNGVVEVLNQKLIFEIDSFDLDTKMINKLEAKVIADKIQLERSLNSTAEIAILYQRLAPSFELIQYFMDRNIGFTAQFKISVSEDPILCILILLIRRKIDKNPEKNISSLFHIQNILSRLEVQMTIVEEDLVGFDNDLIFWGPKIALKKMMHKFNMTIENSDLNILFLDQMISFFKGDLENVIINFFDEEPDRLSLDFRFGKDSHLVQIMTAHASKGLEFDVVFVAGIYTNGKDSNDYGFLGKIPGSFRWYQDLATKKSQITPQYLLEKEISKYKNFSESKRLFYVACTRAVNKLIWINFDIGESKFKSPKNSWIEALRNWLVTISNEGIVGHSFLPDLDLGQMNLSVGDAKLPLYFFDKVGVIQKDGHSNSLNVMGELSVTRLGALNDCPRKHYFQNILKLEVDDENSFFESQDDQEELVIHSNAARGTIIHQKISEMIVRNLTLPRDIIGTDIEKNFNWLRIHLLNHADKKSFRSEIPIKFKLFNFMISGIPDLVIFDESKPVSIWDFKTGASLDSKLSNYWFQLLVYSYGLFNSNIDLRGSFIDLHLIFIDEMKILTKRVSYSEVVDQITLVWKKLDSPWLTNLDHCSQCKFSQICEK